MTRSPLAPRALSFVTLVAFTLLPAVAAASPTGGGPTMPWDAPLTTLIGALTGTTARLLITLALVLGGAVWAFSRSEEGMKRVGQAVVGGAIMVGAVAIVGALSFTGAVL